jgi:hypothetical protein
MLQRAHLHTFKVSHILDNLPPPVGPVQRGTSLTSSSRRTSRLPKRVIRSR